MISLNNFVSLYLYIIPCLHLEVYHHHSLSIVFLFAPFSVSYSAPWDLHRRVAYLICKSWFLIHHGGYHDLFVSP